ncbi:MAG: lipid-transfer protein [Rugosibacter sp.]
MAANTVFVAGVGMIPFVKPGENDPYTLMGARAVQAALQDAGLDYSAIQQAYAGYVYADSTAGQAVLYGVGMTGIPIINVNNNCASGSSALFLARQAVASGAVDCALAVGFEQMNPGALKGGAYSDRPSPLDRFIQALQDNKQFDDAAPRTPQFFAAAGRAYMDEYGIPADVFGRISVKSRQHAANNPYAVFRKPTTLEEVMASPQMTYPLTRLQCCPPTCGAAAAIVCSESFAKKHGLDQRVSIAGQAVTTDGVDAFGHDMRNLIGYGMAKKAADAAYNEAGIGPEDVDVVELHDCFTVNELLSYEALGLTPPGTAEKFILDGDNTYGGKVVTNPSGGLLSKGHPLGATGLAQCAELTWQLRGQAEARQVEGARIALQHNLGLGGACVVTVYQKH